MKKHKGGTAISAECASGKAADIDEPMTIASEHFLLKPLTVIGRRLG
jgi:hypothetical protein